MKFNCTICNKEYSSYKTLWAHNKTFHQSIQINRNDNKTRNFECEYCNKKFTTKHGMQIHIEKTCKLVETEKQLILLKKEIKEIKNTELNTNNENKQIINNLMDKIVSKDKQIQELKNNPTENKINEVKSIYKTFIINWNNNDHKIDVKDNKFINSEHICNINNKTFNDWFSLELSKDLINEMIQNQTHKIIEVVDGISWINFDLALIISQWISTKLMILINNLIINDIIVNEHNNTIKLKENEIKILKDNFVKKQSREDFPNNCIYIVTTEDNKLKRIYIIGKAKSLKDRLSTYNKTSEHKVIYYKQCGDKETTGLAESVVLKKLQPYKEKANRDRFILPVDQDINFFINIIDQSVNFLK